MRLKNIKELKGLHLESEGGVDEEQDEVGRLGQVAHRVEVVPALEEGDATLLAADHRDRSVHRLEGILGVVLHQTFDEGALEAGGGKRTESEREKAQ